MIEVPPETPVTIPGPPMVATDGLPLIQEPPEVALESTVVEPWQRDVVPVIVAGVGCTSTLTTL
jgi:hypothetical protein